MDLVSAVTDFQRTATMSSVQMAVARKVLNAQRADGAAAIKLIQAATEGFEQAADNMTAAAMGLGGSIDVAA